MRTNRLIFITRSVKTIMHQVPTIRSKNAFQIKIIHKCIKHFYSATGTRVLKSSSIEIMFIHSSRVIVV